MGKSAASVNGRFLMPLIFLFLFPVLKLAVRESPLFAAWSGLSAVGSILSYESLFWIGLDLFQMLKPADDMFGIDILEALFNKTTDVPLKVIISLEFLNLNENKSPFKCSECSKVFDLPSTIAKCQKLLLEAKNILMRGWKNDKMTGYRVPGLDLGMSWIGYHGCLASFMAVLGPSLHQDI